MTTIPDVCVGEKKCMEENTMRSSNFMKGLCGTTLVLDHLVPHVVGIDAKQKPRCHTVIRALRCTTLQFPACWITSYRLILL